MKKLFICSDIHSFYNEWMSALVDKGFDKTNPDHIIVVCGDLMDRGDQTLECLDFVLNLPLERTILIRGNHEDLLEEAFRRGYFAWNDYSNGTVKTCKALANLSKCDDAGFIIERANDNSKVHEYLNRLVDYYEVDNYIFVHGWIPCNESADYDVKSNRLIDLHSSINNWRTAKSRDWHNARWVNGMAAWHNGVKEEGKTIICGHWHCSFGNSKYHNDGLEFLDDGVEDNYEQGIYENFNTFKDEGIMALDACTAYSGKVNCEVIEIEDEKRKNA